MIPFENMKKIPFDKWLNSLGLLRRSTLVEYYCEDCENTGYITCPTCEAGKYLPIGEKCSGGCDDGCIVCPTCQCEPVSKYVFSARSLAHSIELFEQGVNVPFCDDKSDGLFIPELKAQYFAIREEEELLFEQRVAFP